MTDTAEESRRSPLHDVHEELGARFTGFGGWEMPVSYSGIRAEHRAVRRAVGVFDVSHMGEVEVSGPDAGSLMDRLTSNDVGALGDGDAQYAAITDPGGILLDDTVVYRRGPESYLFVPNAGHDAEMATRWADHRDAWDLDAAVENVTDERAMLAVQGPDAPDVLDGVATADLRQLGRFEFAETAVVGVDCLVSRTGYTGEDGYELLAARADAVRLWEAVADRCAPCGLGARDTLRTEMGYLLSGQDFHPEENPRTPLEAGLDFAVDLEGGFVGRDALVRLAESGGPAERIAGFVLQERGVPRHGYPILDADGGDEGTGEVIGQVTSGTMSPTLDVPIGLGYLPIGRTDPGTAIAVGIRDRRIPATVQATPFITDA